MIEARRNEPMKSIANGTFSACIERRSARISTIVSG
jgi:hypothetical protein